MVKFKEMNSAENIQATPAPPSLMASLKAGFDAVTGHIWLILIPAILDIFLWFGTQLSLADLIQNFLGEISTMPELQSTETADLIVAASEIWTSIGESFNLFSALRTYPVGIPSLFAAGQPGGAPIVLTSSVEITSPFAIIGFWLLISAVGLVLGAIFYHLVAQAALTDRIDWHHALRQWPWNSLQVFLLALFWVALVMVIFIPGSCFLTLVSMTGQPFGQLGLLVYTALVVWVLFPFIFSAHGIFVNRHKVWVSVLDSVRITRFTVAKTALFFVMIFVINEGLSVLWRVPEGKSWLLLIGVFGHAFIATGLLAASFVYYRDAYLWVQGTLTRSKLPVIT
jgi:hypothetical protein